jgi:putative transposase
MRAPAVGKDAWQHRPHDALRDPHAPNRMLTPNEKYAATVAVAGYLPLTLTGEDYLELLPVEWRQINDYGIRIDHRTYDSPELGPWRRQPSGVTAKNNRWEVHYDPYDLSQVFVRTPNGWVTAAWTHQAMVSAPFADFTWRHARTLAPAGATETDIARVLDDLLARAQTGPQHKTSARVVARTRAGAATHRPPQLETPAQQDLPQLQSENAQVIPFGVFDADAEAERWL